MRARMVVAACVVAVVAAPCLAGAPAAPAKADSAFLTLTKRLASVKVSLDLAAKPPEEAFELIRKAGSVNIVVAPDAEKALAGKTVTLKLNDVSALSAFHHVLRYLNLCASYADGAYVITAPEAVEPPPKISLYDIRDLTEARRTFRLPPTLFGAQIDPLYYYFRFYGRDTGFAEPQSIRAFLNDLESVDRHDPEPIGAIIAETVSRAIDAKKRGITVSYRGGYLIVVQKREPARISPGEGDLTPESFKEVAK